MKSSILFAVAVLTIASAVSAVHAQGTWEGPTGVFLNPLAIDLAEGKTSVSGHYLNLQPVGSLTTFGVTYGAAKNLEVGLTRADLNAGGQNEFNIFHAKYIAVPFKGEKPAVAIGTIVRDATSGPTTSDFYVAATKIFPAKKPIIASVTARYTNGIGSGLFGKNTSHSLQFGGFLGVQATPKLIAGVEYYGQPEVDDWKDLAVRYVADENTFIDAGIARINDGLDNQFAVALTHQF
ncbi:MAG: DUF3034 family protein [Armatimonadia bacterium]